jgi:hypothetical protein
LKKSRTRIVTTIEYIDTIFKIQAVAAYIGTYMPMYKRTDKETIRLDHEIYSTKVWYDNMKTERDICM